MSEVNTAAVSRFLHQYKGIEGFYFLNKGGELGFIKSDDLRSVKETFPQINDRNFLKIHPDFIEQLEGFLRDLGDLSTLYTDDSKDGFELGYVLPAANDSSQKWRSATLVLHKNVVETLRADENLFYKKGIKDRYNSTELDAEKLQGIRSIQRGLDDLTHHRDVFGMYRYFPVLFYLRDSSKQARLRVLNLKWRPNRERPDGGANAQTAAHLSARETVYSILRDNLQQRGAIDRSKRLEQTTHSV